MLRNYFIACVIGAILSCIGTWRLCYIHYEVKQLQTENKQLKVNNNQLNSDIKFTNEQMQMTESTIRDVTLERDTIVGEYNYANTTIQKYQKQLNARTHIDTSFVRMVKSIELSSSPTTITSITGQSTATDGILTASAGLSYISKREELLNLCIHRSRQKDIWYDNLRKIYNAN